MGNDKEFDQFWQAIENASSPEWYRQDQRRRARMKWLKVAGYFGCIWIYMLVLWMLAQMVGGTW